MRLELRKAGLSRGCQICPETKNLTEIIQATTDKTIILTALCPECLIDFMNEINFYVHHRLD